jgi:hypothetical protein
MSPADACAYLPELAVTGCEYDPAGDFLYCQCKVAFAPPPRSRSGWGNCLQRQQYPQNINAPCLHFTTKEKCEVESSANCVFQGDSCVISQDNYCGVANVEPACGKYGTELGPIQCAQNPLCKWNPAGDGFCETNWIQECPFLGCGVDGDNSACHCLPQTTSPTTAAPTSLSPTTATPTSLPRKPAQLSAASSLSVRVSWIVLVLAECATLAGL